MLPFCATEKKSQDCVTEAAFVYILAINGIKIKTEVKITSYRYVNYKWLTVAQNHHEGSSNYF